MHRGSTCNSRFNWVVVVTIKVVHIISTKQENVMCLTVMYLKTQNKMTEFFKMHIYHEYISFAFKKKENRQKTCFRTFEMFCLFYP